MADNIKDQIIDNYLKLFINDFNDTKNIFNEEDRDFIYKNLSHFEEKQQYLKSNTSFKKVILFTINHS